MKLEVHQSKGQKVSPWGKPVRNVRSCQGGKDWFVIAKLIHIVPYASPNNPTEILEQFFRTSRNPIEATTT